MFLTLLQSQGGPSPVVVVQAKRSGGNADSHWLRILLQAELNTYKDSSYVSLGGISLESEVVVVRPVIKPNKNAKILKKIEANLSRTIAKVELLNMFDDLDSAKNLKEALLEEFEEDEDE